MMRYAQMHRRACAKLRHIAFSNFADATSFTEDFASLLHLLALVMCLQVATDLSFSHAACD